MRSTTTLTIIAVAILGAGCAAQPVETLTHKESTVREEKNLSTGVTKTIRTTRTVREFSTMDADADGYIVLEELPSDAPIRTTWTQYDSDGDKRITQVEYDAWYVANVDEE